MEVARSKNTVPLPTVKPHCGIRLPPDCHCLAACNYKLKTIKKTLPKSSAAHGAGSTAGARVTSMIGGARAVNRPNSPAVRVTSIGAGTGATNTTPRPLVKINTGSATSTLTPAPKIQIAIPPQANPPQAEKMDTDAQSRGIKRERVDDDYDAA